MPFAIEQDQSARSMRAMRKLAHARVGHSLRQSAAARRIRIFAVWRERLLALQKIRRHFRHHNFHDAFAVPGTRNAARFGIGVTSAADQRRITDASRKFAASAACRSAGGQMPVLIERHSADGARFVPHMMFRGVRILPATAPRHALAFVYQFFRRAECDAVLGGRARSRITGLLTPKPPPAGGEGRMRHLSSAATTSFIVW